MRMYTVPKHGWYGIMPGRGLTVSGFHTERASLELGFQKCMSQEPTRSSWYAIRARAGPGMWKVRMRAHVAGQSVENELIEDKRVATPMMDTNVVDVQCVLGTVEIDSAGDHTLSLEIASDFTGAKPKFRSVMLVPVVEQD